MESNTSLKGAAIATIEQGEALFCEAKYEEALQVFRALLESNPTDSAALNNAGLTSIQLGDMKSAFDCLHAALRADASCAPAFFNLLDMAIHAGALEAARKIFVLWENGIADSNEKESYKFGLFSAATDEMIEAMRREEAAATESAMINSFRIINQQTHQMVRSAA